MSLEDLVSETLQEFSQLDDDMDRFSNERRIIDEFVSDLVERVCDGDLKEYEAERAITAVADETAYTKTQITNEFADKKEEKQQETSKRKPLNEWIEEKLIDVDEIRTTDSKQRVVWRWNFADGTVEVSSTSDGVMHFEWSKFRDEIYIGTGELPGKPVSEFRSGEDWKKFIHEILDEYKQVQVSYGPRSLVKDNLIDFIASAKAYLDLKDALEYQGIVYPEDETEIWVPNHRIKRLCEAEEITPRALQVELKSCGVLSERVNGAAETTTLNVDGSTKTVKYWVLDADEVPDPREVVEDPESPAEMLEDEDEEESDLEMEEDETGNGGGDGSHQELGQFDELSADKQSDNG